MSSYSPSAAESRLSILTSLYQDRLRPNFSASFDVEKFPGMRKHEMLLELFKQMAAKCQAPDEVAEVFRRTFPNERSWWFDEQFPPTGADEQGPVRTRAT
jgi:hypothetical protein